MKAELFGGLVLVDLATGAPRTSPGRKPLAIPGGAFGRRPAGHGLDQLTSPLLTEFDNVRARRALAPSIYALRRERPGREIVDGRTKPVLSPETVASDVEEFETMLTNVTWSASADIRCAHAVLRARFLDRVYFTDGASFRQSAEATRTIRAPLRSRGLRLSDPSQRHGPDHTPL